MMKLSMLFPFAFLAFAANSFALTENQIRIIFNNGLILPGLSCDAADTLQLLKAIDGRRFLRANVNQDVEETQERNLQTTYYPASCRNTCAGFLPGTCLAQGCRGYRRETNEVEEMTGVEEVADENGRLLQSEWCVNAMKHADNYLDSIINSGKVSSSCTKLLQTTRRMDCMIVTC